MKTITFVVPAYNAEKFLRKCLSSFCKDSILSKIEVIVVNDGSDDSTPVIAQEYCAHYPDTFHLVNKNNGGHGSGINCAIKLAQGRYFKAIDADDWVVTNHLDDYVNALDHTDADVVMNAYQSIHMITGKVITYPLPECVPPDTIDMERFMALYPQIRDCCSFHGITYRTEMYRNVDFQLSEKIFYEDQEYASVFLTKAESVLLLPFVLYQYSIGNGEQSIAYHNQVKRISHIEAVMVRVMKFKNECGPFIGPVEELLLQKLSMIAASYYAVALIKNPDKRLGRRQAAQFSELLKRHEPILLERTAKKRKTMELMNWLHISPYLYQAMIDMPLYRKIREIWMR